jgi:hypothetical protein
MNIRFLNGSWLETSVGEIFKILKQLTLMAEGWGAYLNVMRR